MYAPQRRQLLGAGRRRQGRAELVIDVSEMLAAKADECVRLRTLCLCVLADGIQEAVPAFARVAAVQGDQRLVDESGQHIENLVPLDSLTVAQRLGSFEGP